MAASNAHAQARLGERELAGQGRLRTYDMGGKDSTLDVAKAIADYASS